MEAQKIHQRVMRARLLASSFLLSCIAVGLWQSRGPAPCPGESSVAGASAARMRQNLNALLGDPPVAHSAGTVQGLEFLERLEGFLDSYRVEHRRIEIPFDPNSVDYRVGNIQSLPEKTILRNLLATVTGTEPGLAPLLVVTHHDSCPFGPGAGDAGSAVVTLLEHIAFTSQKTPRRTIHYLFTDGEEYGLLGAQEIARLDPLPFPKPVFVLNFDARGTRGAVPMFETHEGNAAWVEHLISDIGKPRLTTSLAVTVYRMLPNATDFDVWSQTLKWPGFNFATIGGAHNYHQATDTPEALSDRNLQHMGDHLFAVHAALEKTDDNTVRRLSQARGEDAVFFDIFGLGVIRYTQSSQQLVAVICFGLLTVMTLIDLRRGVSIRAAMSSDVWVTVRAIFALLSAVVVGFGSQWLFRQTAYGSLRYTPFDLPLGLVVICFAFVGACLVLGSVDRAWPPNSNPDRGTRWQLGWSWDLDGKWASIAAFCISTGRSLFVGCADRNLYFGSARNQTRRLGDVV